MSHDYHQRLNQIINQIHAAEGIRDIILEQTPKLIELFDADRVTIYSLDTRTNQLFSLFKEGSDVNEIRVPRSHGSIAGYCAVSGHTANIRDAYDEDELRNHHPELRFDSRWDRQTGFVTRQVLVTPIRHKDHVLGVLQLVNKHSGEAFSDEDLKATEKIAETLGIAFYNQRRIGRAAKPNKFGHLLDTGLISEKALEEAVSYARINSRPIAAVLIEKSGISKERVLKSLAQYYNTAYFLYDGSQRIPEEFRDRFAFERLKKLGIAPIGRVERTVTVALEDPSDLEKVDLIRIMNLGPRVEYAVALPGDIDAFLGASYGAEKDEEEHAPLLEEILGDMAVEEQAPPEPEASESDSNIVRAASQVVKEALAKRASDIHIEPYGDRQPTVIRFRVDGSCHVHQEIPAAHRKALISRFKIMANLDIAEKRKPQDGKIRFQLGGRLVELRVATVPTAGGEEDVVLRILAASEPMPLEKMAFSRRNLQVIREMAKKPYGIILCVGPTGSGKTTTLHSLLGHINVPERKIWTAEDPVEITQHGLRQVEVKPKIGFGFASAMRSFLRADPDVIMVGEMRDHETAAIGIEASLTGHLVLSTLHTNSAPETISRLLEMDIDTFNFADALIGILAQRLVRTLCSKCKEAYLPSRQELASLIEQYGEVEFANLGIEIGPDLRLCRSSGCAACGRTGYRGRMALHELLDATDDIKRLVLKGATIPELREQATADGMSTLLQDGIRKVFAGHTDIAQVRAVCLR
jgi:type II secretory ATPase GspE/PulE/Tfp pilus assembly ATPase PilB-like protein